MHPGVRKCGQTGPLRISPGFCLCPALTVTTAIRPGQKPGCPTTATHPSTYFSQPPDKSLSASCQIVSGKPGAHYSEDGERRFLTEGVKSSVSVMASVSPQGLVPVIRRPAHWPPADPQDFVTDNRALKGSHNQYIRSNHPVNESG